MSDAKPAETEAEVPEIDPSVVTAGGAPLSTYWVGKRRQLLKWLTKVRPSLAELYEGAVELTYGSVFPGRVRFICHAVREIKNRLPEAISGVEQAGRVDYVSRMDEVSRIARRGYIASDPKTLPFPMGPTIAPDRQLLTGVLRLVTDHDAARKKPEDAAYQMFSAAYPDAGNSREALKPVIAEWRKVTRWFEARAHDNGQTDSECDHAALVSNFETLEGVLAVLAQEFFVTMEELDDILAQANRR